MARAQPVGYPAVPGEVIIKFKARATSSQRAAILADLGATRVRALPLGTAQNARIARLSVEQAIARYRGNAEVEFIEPNYLYRTVATIPNDPMLSQQWAIRNTGQTGGLPGADIRATLAWDVFTGSQSVLVATTDTGMDYNHPDLSANAFVNPSEIPGNGIDDDLNGYVDDVRGWDFANDDNDPMDDNGHGTHVAGIIGAAGNNALGVAGVCWNVTLLPVKFLDASGSGSADLAVRAIGYVVAMGGRVINASWASGGPSEALRQAIEAAGEAGVLVVAAAGNNGSNNDLAPNYPSSYDLPNIVAVAASNHNDRIPLWSNYGATTVDLAAPGETILSTLPNGGYGWLGGTSMATPHVSGALALILGYFPGITGTNAKSLLLSRTDPLPAMAGLVGTGGRLNAYLPIAQPDDTPPGPIVDLATSDPNATRITLHWTATGDDGGTGTATRYDVRYATAPITTGNFGSATPALDPPLPGPPGTAEQMEIRGLEFGSTYYFAIKVFDKVNNASPLSNLATGTTLGAPDVAVSPNLLDASLLSGQRSTQILHVSNSGPGELTFVIHAVGLAGTIPPGTRQISSAQASDPRAPRPAMDAQQAFAGAFAAGHPPIRNRITPDSIRADGAVAGGVKILMLQSGADVSEILSLVASFPDIQEVDVFDAQSASPALTDLLPYHAVIVVANQPFGNAVAMGDVLADYADAGGGVILTMASFLQGWNVQGRLLTGGYLPFTLGAGNTGSSALGSFDATHPIMAGVTSATGSVLANVGLATGAQLVASWANGRPFVATRGEHVAAVNIFVGGTGYWTGQVPAVLHNAVLWSSNPAPWLSAEPRTGVLPAGGALDALVTFDATGLGGDYDARILVTSDDPDEGQISIPAHLHATGAPDIAGSPTGLQFGSVMTGDSRPETLTVTNPGTQALSVSGVSVTPARFDAPTSGFILQPGESLPLVVTFSPQNPVLTQGTLTIASNDPDEASLIVPLSGIGVVPPQVSLNPNTMTATLFTGGVSTRTLLVHNAGGVELGFDVTLESVPVVVGVGAKPWAPSSGQHPTPEQGAMRSEQLLAGGRPPGLEPLSAPGGKVLLVQDVLPWGTTANEQVLTAHQLVYDQIGSVNLGTVNLAVYDRVILAGDQQTAFYTRAATQAGRLEEFVRDGGVLEFHAAGWGPAGGDASVVTIPGGMSIHHYVSQLDDVLVPAHSLMTGVPDPMLGTPASNAYFGDVPAGAAQLATDDLGRPTLVVYPLGEGLVIAGAQTYEYGFTNGQPAGQILQNMIPYGLSSPVGWLTVSPITGGVPPGGTLALTVRLDAAGLPGGSQAARLHVRSNDSDEPEVIVPVVLQVTGAADILVQGQSVLQESIKDFQTDGARTTHTFTTTVDQAVDGSLEIEVNGDFGQLAEVADVSAEGLSVGTVGRSGADCVPASSIFDFSQADLDQLMDDGRVEVSAQNTSLVGPNCFVNRHTVRLRYRGPGQELTFAPLLAGQCAEQRLEVSNPGVQALAVGSLTSSHPSFTVTPASLSLSPGQKQEVVVRFCPTSAGAIEGTLHVSSNDPDEAEVTVPLHGTGLAPPEIALAPAILSADLAVGQTTTQTLRIANDGEGPLSVTLTVRPELAAAGTPGGRDGVAPSVLSRGEGAAAGAARSGAGAGEGRYRERYEAYAAAAPQTPHARESLDRITEPAPSPGAPAGTAQDVTVPTALPQGSALVYFDDMEKGANGWTHTSTHANHVDFWAQTTSRASSGSTSWHVAQHTYEGSDALRSPAIDLQGLTQATLSFRHWDDFDDCLGDPSFEPDGGIVEVFQFGSWQQIFPIDDYPFVLDNNCSNPLAGMRGYAHASGGGAFATAFFDLTPFVDQVIQLRFQAGWDCGNCGLNEGWYVDDVAVYTDTPQWLVPATAVATIDPHTQLDVIVTFDARNQAAGSYAADLRVNANDPNEPQTVVPVSLRVADVAATVAVAPNPFDPRTRGPWVIGSLELPSGRPLGDVVLSSVRLNGASPADLEPPPIGDQDSDGVPDMPLKFDWTTVLANLGEGDQVPMAISGELQGGGRFLGSQVVPVVRHRVMAPNGGEIAPSSGTYVVSWSLPPDPPGWQPDHADLAYSLDAGVTWLPMAAGRQGTSFAWPVPAVTSNAALVRVTLYDAVGLLAYDSSDQVFTIRPGPTDVGDDPGAPPVAMLGNRPNPFGPRTGTSLEFRLGAPGQVRLRVYDTRGQLIRVLVEGTLPAATHRVSWDGRDRNGRVVASGVYFYCLEAGGRRFTRRMTFLK